MRTAVLLFVILTFSHCTPGNQELDQIRSNIQNQDPEAEISLEEKQRGPFLGSDSLAILRSDFDQQKSEMMDHLNKAVLHADSSIASAKEGKKGGFKALEKVFDETIATSERTKSEALAIIETLNGDCKGTRLEDLYNQITYYENHKDTILGTLVTVLVSNNGGKAVEKRFLFHEKTDAVIEMADHDAK